jgi:hypothetical protein
MSHKRAIRAKEIAPKAGRNKTIKQPSFCKDRLEAGNRMEREYFVNANLFSVKERSNKRRKKIKFKA